jgi:hypothetical protein
LPDVAGVDTHGIVLLVVVTDVLVVLELVDVLLLVVVVTIVGASPQRARAHAGSSPTTSTSTMHVMAGSAQCVAGTVASWHSSRSSQRGPVGSTQTQPAKTGSVTRNAANVWHRWPAGHVPPQLGYSPPSQGTGSGLVGSVVGVVIAGWQIMRSQLPSFIQRSQTCVGSSQC